ncbi:hypothetical protein LAWI1_G008439 [Lachnellula willkommii]|uniref:Protein kinase domain-containing protein n=1 Tax=Lachnellula willkommii TaxID=215461 RepID=A0A559MAS6_9HELO|nr:hypothetical protein LAWI1_G008439 [Lachnellula willkommii]
MDNPHDTPDKYVVSSSMFSIYNDDNLLEVLPSLPDGSVDLEDFYDWALTPCLQLFKDNAPEPEQKLIKLSLHDYYHPETFQYRLHAVADKLIPVVNPKASHFLPPGVTLDPSILHPSWPIYTDSEVFLDITKPSQALCPKPSIVVVQNSHDKRLKCFFKSYDDGAINRAVSEVENHRKLTKANLAPDMRVCRVQGVVKDDRGRVMGLLLNYIDCEYVTLTCAAYGDGRDALKHKWVEQVKETLAQLHGAGLVWGDAKPDNVLIGKSDGGNEDAENGDAEIGDAEIGDVEIGDAEDWNPENKDAWLVDFGGGYTQGFVDKEIAGTVEGDLQGLDNIIKYVFEGQEDGGEEKEKESLHQDILS